jgi:uncharacterized membrane protein
MARVEKAIEVERPVEVVYDHLTQLRWTEPEEGSPGLEIVEQVRDEVVAWRGAGEDADAWRASLIALSPKRTRVDLAIDHDPHGLLDRAAGAFGSLERRVDDDLARFKTHVEAHSPAPD